MVWSTLGPGPWPLVSWWCLYTTQAGRQGGSLEGQAAGRGAGSPRPLRGPELVVTGSGQSGGLAWRTTVLGDDESLHRASAHIQHMGKWKAPTDQIQRGIKCLPRFSNSYLGRCWDSRNSPQRFYCKIKMGACFPNSLGKRTN